MTKIHTTVLQGKYLPFSPSPQYFSLICDPFADPIISLHSRDISLFDYHICNKANRTIGFLKRNLNIGSTTVKQSAYKALVRPLVECASPVWDPYHRTEIDRIEMVQRRAARYTYIPVEPVMTHLSR
jgi:hypothetical protein